MTLKESEIESTAERHTRRMKTLLEVCVYSVSRSVYKTLQTVYYISSSCSEGCFALRLGSYHSSLQSPA